jgi:hypothetical protein
VPKLTGKDIQARQDTATKLVMTEAEREAINKQAMDATAVKHKIPKHQIDAAKKELADDLARLSSAEIKEGGVFRVLEAARDKPTLAGTQTQQLLTAVLDAYKQSEHTNLNDNLQLLANKMKIPGAAEALILAKTLVFIEGRDAIEQVRDAKHSLRSALDELLADALDVLAPSAPRSPNQVTAKQAFDAVLALTPESPLSAEQTVTRVPPRESQPDPALAEQLVEIQAEAVSKLRAEVDKAKVSSNGKTHPGMVAIHGHAKELAQGIAAMEDLAPKPEQSRGISVGIIVDRLTTAFPRDKERAAVVAAAPPTLTTNGASR